MKQRFSHQELFALRNHIPIDTLIEKILVIPSKFSEGYLRFLCPLCNEFNTAINHKTNLARCFICKKNFNPIDMVMTIKKAVFVEAVTFLKIYLNNLSQFENCHPSSKKLSQEINTNENIKRGESSQLRKNNKPVHIGEILHKTLPLLYAGSPHHKEQSTERIRHLPVDHAAAHNNSVSDRIEKLEQQMQSLSSQLEKVISIIEKNSR